MRRLRFTKQAISDLSDVAAFLRSSGADAVVARRVTDDIRAKCRALAKLPGTLGRERNDLRRDLRSFAIGNHVIFFQYRGDLFEVVSILDGRRDIDAIFARN